MCNAVEDFRENESIDENGFNVVIQCFILQFGFSAIKSKERLIIIGESNWRTEAGLVGMNGMLLENVIKNATEFLIHLRRGRVFLFQQASSVGYGVNRRPAERIYYKVGL